MSIVFRLAPKAVNTLPKVKISIWALEQLLRNLSCLTRNVTWPRHGEGSINHVLGMKSWEVHRIEVEQFVWKSSNVVNILSNTCMLCFFFIEFLFIPILMDFTTLVYVELEKIYLILMDGNLLSEASIHENIRTYSKLDGTKENSLFTGGVAFNCHFWTSCKLSDHD